MILDEAQASGWLVVSEGQKKLGVTSELIELLTVRAVHCRWQP